MRSDDYFSAIAESDPAEWLSASCNYLALLGQVSGGGRDIPWIEMDAPHSLYTYTEDLSISIAIGRNHLREFKEDWAKEFNGAYPSSGWVDFLYNGQTIYNALYVAVDGGRALLPVQGVLNKVVPTIQNDIYRLLHYVSGAGGYNYDDYMRRSGAIIVDTRWPVTRE